MENKSHFSSLSRSKDFQHLKAKGRSLHVNSWLLVNWQQTQSDLIIVRCGWTIPRQTGPAVLRNRFKRWGREYFRKWAQGSKRSLDMNLIFKRKEKGFYKSISRKDFDEAMDNLMVKVQRHIK